MTTGNESEHKIAIIGAGISGLAAAWELADANCQVEVFERDSTPGGLAGWFETSGTTLEKYYHHLYNKDTDLIELIRQVGLGDNLRFRKTVTGAFYVNRIYRLSSPLDLLRYSPLSLAGRIRLGLMAVRAKFVKDWRELDDLSAREWIIRLAGENVYESLWRPLFRSKFGRYASEVSAAWLWSKLVQRGGSRSKGGSEVLGYLEGGYGVLFKRLSELLREKGIKIHLSTPVTSVRIENGRATGIVLADEIRAFDAVLATVQVPDYLAIVPDLPAGNRKSLKAIGFLANACLVLQLNRRLSDTYWVNITDTSCPFVGVIEQTNLLDASHYQGSHFAYLSRYMDPDDPYYAMDAGELFEAYLPYLEKIFPAFKRDWVDHMFIWRENHAQPVVSVGYRRLIPTSETPVKALYLSTMAQIFPEDRQMSNGVKLARNTARLMLKNLRGQSPG
ncbi:NAD(P)/FAD-dependent oxidoreductase [bacterium]|nr:NAD(P)/FAD-dependent oxidoreductase [candidate division CSSED10-310 bacterium]